MAKPDATDFPVPLRVSCWSARFNGHANGGNTADIKPVADDARFDHCRPGNLVGMIGKLHAVVMDSTDPRGLAEFWADGPDSETPPGHWYVILNDVSDHPSFVKQLGGTGPVLNDLEWCVKTYLAMGGAMHDAAIAAWASPARSVG